MRLLVEHFFAAFLIGSAGWFFSRNFYCVPSALIAGWLIDVDHLYDFFLYSLRKKKINLAFIQPGEYFKVNNQIIFPLHAWEISVLLLLLGILISEYRAPFISAAISHAIHLFQDQWKYRVRLFGYSFISRMKCSFAYKDFCRIGND